MLCARSACVAVVLALGALAPSARAQDDARLARAEQAFIRASTAYARGDYRGARQGFTEAYELTENPSIRYNLGLVEERVGNLELAAEHYRAYLRAPLPDDEARAARERLAAVEAQITTDERREAPRGEDEHGSPEPAQGGAIDPVPIVILSGGVLVAGALAATAAGFWVAANDGYAGLDARCAPACSDDDIRESGVPGQVDVTNALLVSSILVGVAAVATSIVLFVIQPSPSSMALRVGPAQLTLAGTFH